MEKRKLPGVADVEARYTLAGRALGEARIRNRPLEKGGCNCPILVEGRRDRVTLEAMNFSGPIELVNRGWDQSRLVAYLFEKYGKINPVDGGTSLILLMDWDRTGGRLQRGVGNRLEAFGMQVDQETRQILLRSMKPEGRTVESLKPHVEKLIPYIDAID
ncbi:MAG: hypothetical protein QF440_04965 [Candidatus Thalassarchaeaceae archaeon]|jgi:5S rRNA maturation endonuclease (ribonuclease M5)|nr:hypothetical protein [Candidatus Thalassarchaeaceae archaeon]